MGRATKNPSSKFSTFSAQSFCRAILPRLQRWSGLFDSAAITCSWIEDNQLLNFAVVADVATLRISLSLPTFQSARPISPSPGNYRGSVINSSRRLPLSCQKTWASHQDASLCVFFSPASQFSKILIARTQATAINCNSISTSQASIAVGIQQQHPPVRGAP